MHWQTSRRKISLTRPLVMGILNVTPDSFSDGGRFADIDDALRQAEKMIADGVDIIDVGGESTRPGGSAVSVEDELDRTIPVLAAIAKRFDTPISIDTTKSSVAAAAIDSGAEIINDISGLRFDETLADIAADSNSGLVLMHSIGDLATMHTAEKPADAVATVIDGLRDSVKTATDHGVSHDQIVLDVGIGFGKTPVQNFELIAKLDNIVGEFDGFPVLVGASRKSFLTSVIGDVSPSERNAASVAAALEAVARGVSIVRVHDVAETVQALRVQAAVSDIRKRK